MALNYFNVKDYGAVGNGIADDTAWIQSAFDAAKNTGGAGSTIFIPRSTGAYMCEGLDLNGNDLRLTGDGTLKLKGGSTANFVLRISGDYHLISGIRIDGNRAGSPTGAGNGLDVTGDYNHVRDVTVFNTKTANGSANVVVGGTHNLVEEVWSNDAGGAAFRDAGDYNQYLKCIARNWGYAGFYRPGSAANERLDIDGGYFEPGADSAGDNCIWFDGANSIKMVAIRNTVVNWLDSVTPSGSPVLGKFTKIDRLILDNCLFKHKHTLATALTTVEIGAGVKRAYFDHTFLSRQLKLNSIDSDAIVMLSDTQIGDAKLWAAPSTQPTVSVLGIAGAQFIARSSRFIGYTGAALELVVNLNTSSTFVHFEASDCEFQGYNAFANDTYDVKVAGSGVVNASRKILWLNNRRSVTGGGSAHAIVTSDLRILFTTRDWSKRVYESTAKPSITASIAWQQGDTSMHTTPTSPGTIGWVYIAGAVNDWKTFGAIT